MLRSRMRLGAADSLSPDVHARLVAMAVACLGPGRWYCLPDHETAFAVRAMHGRARFVPSVDAAHPREKGPRPWLVMAYSPREGSPVALARPASTSSRTGVLVGSHEGKHVGEEAGSCRLRRPESRLTVGEPVPLPAMMLCPERFSCREPEFGRLRAVLRAWEQRHRSGVGS
jgi:hypothetical protein